MPRFVARIEIPLDAVDMRSAISAGLSLFADLASLVPMPLNSPSGGFSIPAINPSDGPDRVRVFEQGEVDDVGDSESVRAPD